jgi:hypothetical protein
MPLSLDFCQGLDRDSRSRQFKNGHLDCLESLDCRESLDSLKNDVSTHREVSISIGRDPQA